VGALEGTDGPAVIGPNSPSTATQILLAASRCWTVATALLRSPNWTGSSPRRPTAGLVARPSRPGRQMEAIRTVRPGRGASTMRPLPTYMPTWPMVRGLRGSSA